MTELSRPALSGSGDDLRECAKQIGDQITPLVKVSRSRRFDFLAYLLAMALRESQRLAKDED
jgi:ADP-heptose:LPS heptosyltransferase